MRANAPSVKRYVVRLSAEERFAPEAMIRKGQSPAQRLLKARILLKADVSEDGEGWSDSRIIEALETSVSMVYRVEGEGAYSKCLHWRPNIRSRSSLAVFRPSGPRPAICSGPCVSLEQGNRRLSSCSESEFAI